MFWVYKADTNQGHYPWPASNNKIIRLYLLLICLWLGDSSTSADNQIKRYNKLILGDSGRMKFGLIYDGHQQPHESLQSISGFREPRETYLPTAVTLDCFSWVMMPWLASRLLNNSVWHLRAVTMSCPALHHLLCSYGVTPNCRSFSYLILKVSNPRLKTWYHPVSTVQVTNLEFKIRLCLQADQVTIAYNSSTEEIEAGELPQVWA